MLRHKLRFSEKAVLSPYWDLLLTGGLSVALMSCFTAYLVFLTSFESYSKGTINFVDLVVLQALINWPHFMASYKQLYCSRSQITRYPTASLTVPCILILFCVAGWVLNDAGQLSLGVNKNIAYFFWMFSAFYLAWHYTGQTWGMIAVFSKLSGLKIKEKEKRVLRLGLKSLIVWHIVWGIQGLPRLSGLSLIQSGPAMLVVNCLAVASFVAGLLVFHRILKRSPTLDPRVFVPWLTVYLWYLVLFLEPGAYIYVQLSHALQYLIFPVRIEINKSQKQAEGKLDLPRLLVRFSLYYTTLVVSGLLIFYLPDVLIGAPQSIMTIGGMLAIAVNIHHYYVDSVIWKLRSGSVRDELFCHLKPKAYARKPAAAASLPD